MLWVKTANGLVNIAHAMNVDYDASKKSMTVWWSQPLPTSGSDKGTVAEIFDTNRLGYYHVEEHDWLAVLAQALPHG